MPSCPVIAGTIAGLGLIAALLLPFWVRRYLAGVYWLAVVMVAIFGTMAADGLHLELGIPYLVTSPFYLLVLALVFLGWHQSEQTLSIHSIFTLRREAFYWAAVMATFALGTAAGDLTAITFGLGYFDSALLFAVLISLPALGYWLLGLNSVFAFWLAYVLTRPLGASIADWLGVPQNFGGLGWGRGTVSLSLSVLIVALVGYLAVTGKDRPQPELARQPQSWPPP